MALKIEPVRVGQNVGYLVFDTSARRLVPELTMYALHMENTRGLDSRTVYKRLSSVSQFWLYLQRNNLSSQGISESTLRLYRDEALGLTQHQLSHRGDVRAAKRTVNEKLGAILQWLSWMHEQQGVETLPGGRSHARSDDPFRHRFVAPVRKFGGNIIYRNTGATSKHHVGYLPNETTLDEVTKFFFRRATNAYAAHRNALVVQIANVVGFRRGSINSLTVAQFDRPRLEESADEAVLVRPLSQKFGYQNDYAFPVLLALRICDFIDRYRSPFVESKHATSAATQDRIFLSSRDARPLTDRAITHIVSTAMRSVGAPKGAGLHTVRAKYANDEIEEELFVRRERGMDTSTASVAASVAMKLGQRNAMSLFPYVASGQSLAARKDGAERRSRVNELTAELERTKAQLKAALEALNSTADRADE